MSLICLFIHLFIHLFIYLRCHLPLPRRTRSSKTFSWGVTGYPSSRRQIKLSIAVGLGLVLRHGSTHPKLQYLLAISNGFIITINHRDIVRLPVCMWKNGMHDQLNNYVRYNYVYDILWYLRGIIHIRGLSFLFLYVLPSGWFNLAPHRVTKQRAEGFPADSQYQPEGSHQGVTGLGISSCYCALLGYVGL